MCARPYSCLPRVLDGPRDLATSRGQAPGQQGLTLVHFSVQRKHFLWDEVLGFSLKTPQKVLRLS
jgi:hypothetical protein